MYNLVREGDAVTAKTFRKVTSTSVDGGGNSEKVSIKLTVNVEKVDFDPEGKRDCVLTLSIHRAAAAT